MPSVRAVGVALAVSLVACSSPVATPSDDTTPTPSAQPVGPAECPDIELRGPSGARINLTGTWETEREGSRAGVYFVRQVGECAWFAGGFPASVDDPEFGPLGIVTVVFRGQVRSDFTIQGEWIDLRSAVGDAFRARGRLTLRIDFIGSGEEVRLVYAGGSGQPFVEPGYREEQSWIKISERGAYPPTGQAPP